MSIERLREVCARYALQQVAHAVEPTWEGLAGAVPLRVVCVPEGSSTRVRLEFSLPVHRRSLVVVGLRHVIAINEGLPTGDKRFDASCYLVSADAAVVGCFDAGTRRTVTDLIERGAYISGGALRYSEGAERFEQRDLEALLAVSERLSMDEELTNRELIRLALEDPDADVRERYQATVARAPQLRSLNAQAQIGREQQANTETFERLVQRLHDPSLTTDANLDAANRLIALFQLGQLERPLLAIAPQLAAPVVKRLIVEVSPSHGGASFEVGLRMIRELAVRHIFFDDALYLEVVAAFIEAAKHGVAASDENFEFFARLIAHPAEAMLALLIRVLAVYRYDAKKIVRLLSPMQSRAERLMPVLSRKYPEIGAQLLWAYFERLDVRDVDAREQYVRSMAITRDSSVCEALAGQLDTPFETFQLVVVKALGILGTITIVPMLQPYTGGMFRASEIKDAAREAIAAIRERAHATALPGALSLAEVAGPGGLALAEKSAEAKQTDQPDE